MTRITDFGTIESMGDTDVFLTDGASGTKIIEAQNVARAIFEKFPTMHAQMFRGKNLGSSFSSSLMATIQSGAFKDLWIGDYWIIGGVTYRIVDFDYFMGVGAPVATSKHHLVVMPDKSLYARQFHDSSTANGYINSDIFKTGLQDAKTKFNAAFQGNILSHPEQLSNAADGNGITGSIGTSVSVDLPSIEMMTGYNPYQPYEVGTQGYSQFSLFRLNRQLSIPDQTMATKTMYTNGRIARLTADGSLASWGLTNSYGIRPYALIGA